jgi:nitrite reductase/ring-hydroxylating ferredoxin subunit
MGWIKIFEDYDSVRQLIPSGTIKTVRVDGKKMCLALYNDELLAFEPRCPHMDYPLDEGSINPDLEVVCPWHSYRFDLRHGAEISGRCRDLVVYPIESRSDGLYMLLP